MKAEAVIFSKVYTEDGSISEGIAVAGDRIIAVGTKEEISEYISEETEVINQPGSFLLPGFADGHAHISFAQKVLSGIDLSGAKDDKDCHERICRFKSCHDRCAFVYGQGFSTDSFGENGNLKDILDEIYPDTPALLESDGCHSLWVNDAFICQRLSENSSCLKANGVFKDNNGELTGYFCEEAAYEIQKLMPKTDVNDYKKAILKFQDKVIPRGIQMIHEPLCYNSLDEIKKIIAAYRELDEERKLLLTVKVTVKCMPSDSYDELLDYVSAQRNNPGYHFGVQGIKLFMDGVVEERTAFLKDDYADMPGFKGEPIWEENELKDLILKTRLMGIPVHVHTMGDGATEMILDALEYAATKSGVTGLRDTLTHLQVLDEDQCGRIAALGITACINTYWHFHEHSYYASKDLPYLGRERAEAEYRVKSLLDKGVILSQGSDWPVSTPKPLEGAEIGVTRRMPGNKTTNMMTPSEKVDVSDMLKAITYGGAYQLETESVSGSIAQGKKANFILLDKDPLNCDPYELHSIRVIMNWIEGKQVY